MFFVVFMRVKNTLIMCLDFKYILFRSLSLSPTATANTSTLRNISNYTSMIISNNTTHADETKIKITPSIDVCLVFNDVLEYKNL